MTKRALLTIIENSILKSDVKLRPLYDKFMPLFRAVLKDFADNVKITGLESQSIFDKKFAFDNFLRNNGSAAVERQLNALLKELRIWSAQNYAKANPLKIPDGTEQRRMRESVIGRLNDGIAFLSSTDTAENYSAISEKLNAAREALQAMLLPRNDVRVVECYDAIMSQLDVLLLENDRSQIDGCAEIIFTKIVEWQKLRR